MAETIEQEVERLRCQLRCAQQQIKRYASRVLHLQQELDRVSDHCPSSVECQEEVREVTSDLLAAMPLRGVVDAEDVYTSANQAVKWINQFEQRRGDGLAWINSSERTEFVRIGLNEWKHVKQTLKKQHEMIERLRADQSKLLYLVESRPSQREVDKYRVEVDGLKAKLRRRMHTQEDTEPSLTHPLPSPPSITQPVNLTSHIKLQRLVQCLRVGTKRVVRDKTHHQGRSRHWIRSSDDYIHYLIVDSAYLRSYEERNSSTERFHQSIRDSVGTIASEVVATCCAKLNVNKLVDFLPAFNTLVKRQATAECFDRLAVQLRAALASFSACGERKSLEAELSLQQIVQRVEDLKAEVCVLRDLMKPPEIRPYDCISKCMKMLKTNEMEQVPRILSKLLKMIQVQQAFMTELREIMGLSTATNRRQLLRAIHVLRHSSPDSSNAQRNKERGMKDDDFSAYEESTELAKNGS